MKRIIVALVLMFFVLTSTTVVYARNKENQDTFLDSISEFYLVKQQLATDAGSTLVPVGVVRGVNDVYYVEYEYEVVVKDGMDLQVMIDDLLFSNVNVSVEELQDTFHFEIEQRVVEQLGYHEHFLGEEVTANRVAVTVQVSMSDPATFDLFQELVGGDLTFEVYFFAV